MNAQRVAGLTAAISGSFLILGLIAAAAIGPAAFGHMGPSTIGQGIVGGAGGHAGSGLRGPGMMGMGPGMMGMRPGMMGFGTSGPASTPIPNAAEVRVQATNFSFTPNEIHLPKNADVNLTFTNAAGTGVVHDLTVPALGIHIVANPGETKTVGLRGLAPGRYDAYCSVPGHADLGMRATVIVE